MLALLQNKLKRDPAGFKKEFQQQHRHFNSNLELFKLDATASKNAKATEDFSSLITFLCHTAQFYKEETKELPVQLLDLISAHCEKLDPALRRSIVQGLVLLQNRGLVDRLKLLPMFFRLFAIKDKAMRKQLSAHIVNDIKAVNQKHRNHKLNSTLQSFMFTMLKDTNTMAAKKSLQIMIELWRRKIWNDAKTVNAIATACFSKDTSILCTALRFFLGVAPIEDEEEEDDKEREKAKSTAMKTLYITSSAMKGVCKNKKKRTREMQRAKAKIKRLGKQEDGENGHSSAVSDVPALHALHDAQEFAERLFSQLKSSTHAFDVRLLMMNVVSRLVGTQQLILYGLYPFLQKYLMPHQKHVTHILAYLAQASHKLVPEDILLPCIRTLANSFVNDRSSPEVVAVGLNAIRECCARCPLAMEHTLLQDLTQYKKSKEKGVMMAARSLIALFRDVNPAMLHRRDRGKFAEEGTGVDFGAVTMHNDVIGSDLLLEAGIDGAEKDSEDEWAAQDNEGDDEDEDEEEEEDGDMEIREVDESFLTVGPEDEDDEDEEEKEKKTSKKNKKENGQVKDKDKDEPASKRRKQTLAELAQEEEQEEEGEEGDEGDEGEEMLLMNDDGLQFEIVDEGDEGEEEEDDEQERKKNQGVPTEVKNALAVAAEQDPVPDLIPNSSASTSTALVASGSTALATAAVPPSGTEKKKMPIAATRILTPKDFERIKQLKLKKALDSNKGKKDKRHRDTGSLYRGEEQVKDTVDPEDIVGYVKKKKMSKEERLATVREGREGRDKFGAPKEKGGGTTNKDKLKNKPAMLVKYSSKRKAAHHMSFAQKQSKMATHIKGLQNLQKKTKKKLKKKSTG